MDSQENESINDCGLYATLALYQPYRGETMLEQGKQAVPQINFKWKLDT